MNRTTSPPRTCLLFKESHVASDLRMRKECTRLASLGPRPGIGNTFDHVMPSYTGPPRPHTVDFSSPPRPRLPRLQATLICTHSISSPWQPSSLSSHLNPYVRTSQDMRIAQDTSADAINVRRSENPVARPTDHGRTRPLTSQDHVCWEGRI